MAIPVAYDFENFESVENNDVSSELVNAGFHDGTNVKHSTTIVRTGSACIKLVAAGHCRWRSATDMASHGWSFGYYKDSSVSEVEVLFELEYNSGAAHTVQVEVSRDTNNALVVKNGDGTTLATSAISAITLQGWHFIEVYCAADETAGQVIIRVDDVEEINVSSADTVNGVASIVNQIRFRRPTRNAVIDDFVPWDTTGSINNWFLGAETRCIGSDVTIAGDVQQWTVNGAASNPEAIDEAVPNGDTDYNSESTPGKLDLFEVDDLPAGVTSIYAVIVTLQARRETGGTADIKAAAKLSGTTAYGSDINLDTTHKRYNTAMETKPGGGTWVPGDFGAGNVQFGYEIA